MNIWEQLLSNIKELVIVWEQPLFLYKETGEYMRTAVIWYKETGTGKYQENHRYFNPSKNYWFSFNSFLISLIGLYFRCLSFRVVLVNTARPDGAFLFVVWFIHWKRMIRPFLFIDKQKRKLSIHELVDFWLANITKLDDQNRFMQH